MRLAIVGLKEFPTELGRVGALHMSGMALGIMLHRQVSSGATGVRVTTVSKRSPGTESCFECLGTFNHYFGYVKAGCVFLDLPADAFNSRSLSRATAAIGRKG